MLTVPVIALLVLLCLAARAGSTPVKHSPRYQVAAQLNRGLAGTPMAGTGFALEAAGWRYRVHPAFVAAVAGVESTYGAAVCERFNAWGLGSCGRAWRPPAFPSWKHAYDYFARFIRDRWPSALTPYDFHGYCVTPAGDDCPTWPGKVAANMRRLGFGETLRYGR